MPGTTKTFFERHPCLRQALLWSIPALLAGLAVRLYLLHHNPYAYWSEDSNSYAEFARRLFGEGDFVLNRKRRWFYPIFLIIPHALPGSLLQWTAWLQHGIALGATVALAYTVRKVFAGWKLFILPATLLYALHPHFLYFADQVLGESIFTSAIVASIAGWTAWVLGPPARRGTLARFSLFLVPFAIMVLTKPSGRFYWPGLVAALVILFAWQWMRRSQYIALGVLLILTPTVGKGGQGLRLLYSSVFPLTRMDTPLHAEYKAEIAPMVAEARANLHRYYATDKANKNFLTDPARERPKLKLWASLSDEKNEKLRDRIYRDLALEGIVHEPHMVVYIATQRIIGSSMRGLKGDRLTGKYYAGRLEEPYFYPELSIERPQFLKKLFGLARHKPLPPLEEFQRMVAPIAGSEYDENAATYLSVFERIFQLVKADAKKLPPIHQYQITIVGALALFGLILSFFPPWRTTIGSWSLLSLSYLFGVYAVGSMNGRFFIPALPVIFLLWLIPLDAIIRIGKKRFTGTESMPQDLTNSNPKPTGG